jgi:Protein of unknown function (DUF2281)
MSRELLLKKTREHLEKLPDQKLQEASDFVEFLMNKIDDSLLTEGIKKINSSSTSFSFLEEEEVQYKISDLKERYK